MKVIVTDFLTEVDANLSTLNSSLPEADYYFLIQPIVIKLLENLEGESYVTFPHSAVFTYFKDSINQPEGADLWNLFFERADDILILMMLENLGEDSDKDELYESARLFIHKIKENLELINIQKIMVNDIMTDHSQVYVQSTKELFTRLQESDSKVKELMKEVGNSAETLNNIQDDQKTIRLEQKNTQKDFVTILGIFTTIIFAAFGGIQLLGNVLANVSKENLVTSTISGSFVFVSIIIILSLLFSGLSRMTDLSVRSCECKDRNSCSCRFSKKHPTIFYSFLLVLTILPFALLSRYISFETIFKDVIHVQKGVSWTNLFSLVEISIFALIPAGLFYLLDWINFHSRFKKKQIQS